AERRAAPQTGSKGAGSNDREGSLVQSYADPNSWRRFFADEEVSRDFCHNFAGSVLTLAHSEIECYWTMPPRRPGQPSFFNYPGAHPRRHKGRGGATQSTGGGTFLFSDLKDNDIIKGGTPKIDKALDTVL